MKWFKRVNKSQIIRSHEQAIDYLTHEIEMLEKVGEELTTELIFYKDKADAYEKKFGPL